MRSCCPSAGTLVSGRLKRLYSTVPPSKYRLPSRIGTSAPDGGAAYDLRSRPFFVRQRRRVPIRGATSFRSSEAGSYQPPPR
eukprot:2412998-Pyramimonas_sp.AAC.1